MPYANKNKYREYQREWKRKNYQKNKDNPKFIEKRRMAHRLWEAKYYKTEKGRIKLKEKIARRKLSSKYYYRSYKESAKKMGREFALTYDNFMKYWQKPCTYCGSEIKTIGLDRVDNGRGYIEGNVLPCCIICNNMKKTLDVKHFINHVLKIRRHLVLKAKKHMISSLTSYQRQ